MALLVSPVVASAQPTAGDQEPNESPPPAPITTAPQPVAQNRAETLPGDSAFRALHNLVISADGAWMAAEERSDRGDGNVRVWPTKRDVSYTIERGQNPRISGDSRWVSALQKPSLEDARIARPTNKRAGQTLVLLDLQDGSRRTFDFVLSYDMTVSSTYLLYLQSPETRADEEGPSKSEATKPATKERKGATLHQIPLNPDRLARIGVQHADSRHTAENVTQFVTHPTNDHFAYVFHDEESGGETLRIVKWGIRAWYHGDKIEGLCWAGGAGGGDESITLGFLDSTETTGEDGKRRANSALYTWRPAQSLSGKFTRVDSPR